MMKGSRLPCRQDAIRVRVNKQKNAGVSGPDYKKFSIDPQITPFVVLHSIVAKAFDMKGEFVLSYRVEDDYGQETFLPLLNDWDLDAAVLRASDPYLCINIEAKPSISKMKPTPPQVPSEVPRGSQGDIKVPNRLPGLILNKVERTLNIFQRAFNLGEEVAADAVATPPRPPLADEEYRRFLDPTGLISHMKDLRTAIYFGGVEPSLRKVVWKHILNVYPKGMSGGERLNYMKRKTQEYQALKETWRQCLKLGQENEELEYVATMVRRDVLRTDRQHKFYAGDDDNTNVASLFNILTTYAVNHPSVSYCQGMSDLASPLLVTMGDEAHAYICFCALMTRLKPTFMLDGTNMALKFQHLTEGLQQCDPQFYTYLKLHQAEDLLFCYRWLLLEMKREFAFDDALHMLEVQWSSLEENPPEKELVLYEVKFQPQSSTPPSPLILGRSSKETMYSKVCAIRRQNSSVSLTSLSSGRRLRQNQSLDESASAKQKQFRKGHKKPFFSLDDNCMEMHEGGMSNSQSASAVQEDALTLMRKRISSMHIAGGGSVLSNSTGNLTDGVKRLTGEGNSSSMSKLGKETDSESDKKTKTRTVKNLNEFFNFAGRGRPLRSRQRSQCSSISESDVFEGPNITLTRSDVEGCSDLDSEVESIKQMSSPSLSSSLSPTVFDGQHSDDSSPDGPPGQTGHSDSSPDDPADYSPIATSITQELKMELEHLDRNVLSAPAENATISSPDAEVFVWENPIKTAETPEDGGGTQQNGESTEDSSEVPNFLARGAMTNILHSLRKGQILRSQGPDFCALPPPKEFGGGNPFLMFLCLTLLRQHRDFIMRNQLDYNEMAIHFDKMVRKHNVTRVLDGARHMFAAYLKHQSLQSTHNGKNSFKV